MLVSWQALTTARPRLDHALDRVRVARRLDDLVADIRRLHAEIAEARPKTLAGAAVILRRVAAMVDDDDPLAPLVAGVLAVIAADADAPEAKRAA